MSPTLNKIDRRQKMKTLKTESGFTLIEIIAVLIIIAILAAVAIPAYISLSGEAEDKMILSAVSELNSREKLFWAKVKLSDAGWVDDNVSIFGMMDYVLGPKYLWSGSAPAANGGTLTFGDSVSILARSLSTTSQPGIWTKP